MESKDTVMASAIARRILALIAVNGDMPIGLIYPIGDEALPMRVEKIYVNGGQIEIWPAK